MSAMRRKELKLDGFGGGLGLLELLQQKNELATCKSLLAGLEMKDKPDLWLWEDVEGSEVEYRVKNLRWEMDNMKYQKVVDNFWLKCIPIKGNCFVWRLLLDRVATIEALLVRGVNVGDNKCVICEAAPESALHLMVRCKVARWIWAIILEWAKLPGFNFSKSVREIIDYPAKFKMNKMECELIQAIVLVTCWEIWLTRNDMLFNKKTFSMVKVINDIKVMSFLWVCNRNKRFGIDWEKWCRFQFS
ncbi:uncharacterized protein LOC143564901 [Bidens hawaiensis]|uniref:uncharacterized protein LOC143564901 n=1 Tax=Bidens hawaiensis TaxID=980011 RepID=UPI0040491C6B